MMRREGRTARCHAIWLNQNSHIITDIYRDGATKESETSLTKPRAERRVRLPMSASSSLDSLRSSGQASLIGQEVAGVVVVVTIALGLLLSSGAAAS
jgi:hypothetical protein